jgi:molecular chaperone DnaJ
VSSKDWLEKDFYSVLGVAKTATASDIKRAYRKLARELHPDHNPGNSSSEDRFKAVSEAYDVLSDDRKRAEYDEMRSLFESGAFRRGARAGGAGQPFDLNDLFGQGSARDQRFSGASFSDLFGSIFSGGGGATSYRTAPVRGRDVEAEIMLDFLDAVRGVDVPVTLRAPGVCDTCHGTGAKPGTKPRTCPFCGGSGVVNRNQGAFGFAEPCRGTPGTSRRRWCPRLGSHGTAQRSRTRPGCG